MKKSSIIVVIIVIYLLTMLFVFNILPSIMYTTIVLENNVKWQYKNHKWVNYNSDDTLTGYRVFNPNNGEYIGKYDIKYSNKNWLIKENKSFKLYEKAMLASKSSKLQVYGYKIELATNTTDMNKILEKAGLKKAGDLTIRYQIKVDVNNDGNDEILYGLSNMDEIQENQFFVLGINDNGKYYVIKKNTGRMVPSFNIYAIIDVDGDSNLELIIEESSYSMAGNDYSLYSLVDGEYTEMISTGGSL